MHWRLARSIRCCEAMKPWSKQRTFVSLTLALALPSPFGLANLNALALSPGALRSRLRSVRVFSPALIPHAGKEQDLSCAAVARSHTTRTFRGPERDDIIHGGPSRIRSIVVIAPSVEGRRLTNGQKAGGPVYVNGYAAPHCKFSVQLANPRAIFLISQALGRGYVAPRDERAIA